MRRPKSRHWILFWGPPESSSTTFYWIILNFMAIPAFSLLSIGPVWYCATSTAEGRLWRSSTALVTMKKHCKRLSDQIVCHMSYYESIWPCESILTIWPLSITFGKFIKLPTKWVTCAICTSLRRRNVRNFSLGFVLHKPALNHVLLDRFEFLMSRIGKEIDVELVLSQIVHSWDC